MLVQYELTAKERNSYVVVHSSSGLPKDVIGLPSAHYMDELANVVICVAIKWKPVEALDGWHNHVFTLNVNASVYVDSQ